MEKRVLTDKKLSQFFTYLKNEEKSENTINKYMRDVKMFALYMNGSELAKDAVIAYKNKLIREDYAPRSINSTLASLNSFFVFLGRPDLKVKSIRLQHRVFCSAEKELTKEEYKKLVKAAVRSGNERLSLIIQTICSTGIRVSELPFITVEAVKKGEATVSLKGKTRTVFLVRRLQKELLRYISMHRIKEGSVFVTRNGTNISRTNIWKEMKKLCIKADVDPQKVYPHNLRHLFAKTFYAVEKDIVKLADILGHSSIDTTRIYMVTTGIEHRRRLERMRLIL